MSLFEELLTRMSGNESMQRSLDRKVRKLQRRMGIDSYDAEFLDSAKALLKQNIRGMVAAAREGRS